MSSSSSDRDKRIQREVKELLKENFQVKHREEDSLDKLEVVLHGPQDSPYKDGVWKIYVDIPPEYPSKPPKLTFVNSIFHPNINPSGFVCVNLLSEDWDPLFGLVQIFDQIIPQLLREPNPEDGNNDEAATLLVNHGKEIFELTVREYCAQYAKMEDIQPESSEESGNEYAKMEDMQSESSEESGSEKDISEEGSRSSQDQNP